MIVELLFEGARAWIWKNFMRALGDLKTIMEEFLVVLDKACFRWFSTTSKVPFTPFDKLIFEQIYPQLPFIR
jgi:hypothetical protein